MYYFWWALALSAVWFIFGVFTLWDQWDYIYSHFALLIRQYERFEAIPEADRSVEDQKDHGEVCEELRGMVLGICAWCGPAVAIPFFVAWIKGEIIG